MQVYGSSGVLDLELVNGFLIQSTRAGQVCVISGRWDWEQIYGLSI